jgi:hypothetical protein
MSLLPPSRRWGDGQLLERAISRLQRVALRHNRGQWVRLARSFGRINAFCCQQTIGDLGEGVEDINNLEASGAPPHRKRPGLGEA